MTVAANADAHPLAVRLAPEGALDGCGCRLAAAAPGPFLLLLLVAAVAAAPP